MKRVLRSNSGLVKTPPPDGSGSPDVETSRRGYKWERSRFTELLVSVAGHSAAPPYHVVTINTSPAPPTSSSKFSSPSHGSISTSQGEVTPGLLRTTDVKVLCYGRRQKRESTSTSQVEFMPELLLPTDLAALKYGVKRESTSTSHVEFMPELLVPTDLTTSSYGAKRVSPPTVQHVPPILSRYCRVGRSLSAAESTNRVQEDQLAGSATSSSLSTLEPFEVGDKLEKGILEVKRCHVTDLLAVDHDYSDSVDMDLHYDTYDDLIYDDLMFDDEEDSEELYDYRLDYIQGTGQQQREDLETEEAPSWYRNQVSSTGHTPRPPLPIWPDFRTQTPTSEKGCKEDQGEAIKQQLAASVVGQTGTLSREIELADGRGQRELHSERVDENSAGDEAALREGIESNPRPELDDVQRALGLIQEPEAFREAFKALYKFTEASSKRGCFITPKALETTGDKEAKEDERKGSVALLIPKEEPVPLEFDSSRARHFPATVIQVKQDEASDWNFSCSSKDRDPESYQKTRDTLKRLEQVWIKLVKGREIDLNRTTGETFRPDLMHLTIAKNLRCDGLWLNEKKRPIGHCPGVPVGACFSYRVEMAVVGLHRTVQSGIGVLPAEFSAYRRPVATSVVLLTSNLFYKDDRDMGEKVIYSGQGGLCGKTKKYQDQKLERGNLALANSFELAVPVRVIRGHTNQNTRTGRLYSYDGLYKVTFMNYKTGVHGNKVYLYTMVRLPGQGPLPIPSKAALMYKGEDDTDTYLRRVHKSRSRKFRTPTLEIKSTATGSKHSKYKSSSVRPGSEVAPLVPKTEAADGESVPYSWSALSRSRRPRSRRPGAHCPVERVPVAHAISSGSLRESRDRRAKASSYSSLHSKGSG